MSRTYTLQDIASIVDGRVENPGEDAPGRAAPVISSLAPIDAAGPGDLTYLENRKFQKKLESCQASAVLVNETIEVPENVPVIRVRQPGVAWAQVLEEFYPYQRLFVGVSDDAFVGEGAILGEGVGVGPGAFIGPGAKIGARTEIYPGATIAQNAVVGEDCRIYSGVHVYHDCEIGDRVIIHSGSVIGGDGYGYVQEETGNPEAPVVQRKVPQVGKVILEDDVEVGSNTTIDRAALDATVIGSGTKVDNLVMVGHNCKTGSHCLLIAQVGLAGTIELGNYVTIAGQAGLAGHLKVGDRAVIGAKSGIMNDVEPGQVMIGSPALPGGLARRAYAQIENLPDFRRQILDLTKRVAELEAQLAEAGPED